VLAHAAQRVVDFPGVGAGVGYAGEALRHPATTTSACAASGKGRYWRAGVWWYWYSSPLNHRR
jgi:hypothetical protein